MLKRRSAARTPDTARLFVRDSPFMFNSLSPVSRVLEGPEDRIGIVGYQDGVESGAPARDLEGGARRDVSAAVHRELRQAGYLPRRVNPSDERPRAGIEPVTVTGNGFNPSARAFVGWIDSTGKITSLTKFTMNGSGNIPAGTTFQVPSGSAGFYTILVSDYSNSVFRTFQHT